MDVVVLEDVLERLRDLPEYLVQLCHLVGLGALVLDLVHRQVSGVVLHLLLVVRTRVVVGEVLAVKPLEGVNELVGEPQLIALQLLEICFVFSQLSQDPNGPVGDLDGDGLNLTHYGLDEVFMTYELCSVLLLFACNRHNLQNVLLTDAIRVHKFVSYHSKQAVVLHEQVYCNLRAGKKFEGLGGFVHDLR